MSGQPNTVKLLHESTQMLCSRLQPVMPKSDTRHQYDEDNCKDPRVVQYKYNVGTGASYQDNGNVGITEEERAGVIHLVSGWIQQRQPQKVIFLILYLALLTLL
jgi:hypothetical protein